MTIDPTERVLEALRAMGQVVRQSGTNAWMCECPAHDDRHPSLSVSRGANGKTLIKCFSGCTVDQILVRIGLCKKDLFPKGQVRSARRKEVATYLYYAEDGATARHATIRYEPKAFSQYWLGPDGHRVWSFKNGWFVLKSSGWKRIESQVGMGGPAPEYGAMWFEAFNDFLLYNLRGVREASASGGTIWLCEGEKDAEALSKLRDDQGRRITATTQPMGAGKWRDTYTRALDGSRVNMVLDLDDAGKKHGILVYQELTKRGIPTRLFLPAAGKDVSDHLEAGLALKELTEISIDGLITSPQSAVDSNEGAPAAESCELTDLGNAKRFAKEHGADLFYCSQLGGWHLWNGTSWGRDERGGAPVLARWEETLARMQEEADHLALCCEASDSMEERRSHRALVAEVKRHLKRSNGRVGIDAMFDLAKRLPCLVRSPTELDQRLDLLPAKNGVIDLRTGDLTPGGREFNFTRVLGLDYKAGAQCPLWINHLETCTGGDTELQVWLQKAFGYCLTGLTKEQALLFFFGAGATGKTTTLNTIRKILGPFCSSLDKKKLMKRRFEEEIQTHLSRLNGARCVLVSEVEQRDAFDESLIKRLTGEPSIDVRPMRADTFDMPINFKLLLTGNEKPRVSGVDSGIWRRMRLVPFENEIPVNARDKDIELKLLEEHTGILSWLVEGAVKWFHEGLGSCTAVEAASAEYRDEQDSFGSFIEACLILDCNGKVYGSALYESYKKWCLDEGYRAKNNNHFSEDLFGRLKSKGVEKVNDGKGRQWRGVALRSQDGLSS